MNEAFRLRGDIYSDIDYRNIGVRVAVRAVVGRFDSFFPRNANGDHAAAGRDRQFPKMAGD
ncbi:MAG: hypothetical protein H6817_02600 [Phycisphaerales bacterium]|nr:hypothetical protein [Phycisphaerales bacterium]